MTFEWTCLMVKKGPGLDPNPFRNHLQFAACELYAQKWDRMKIKGKNALTGIVESDGKHQLVGTKGGILFRAQVEGEDGEYFINFLMSEDDLETGAKMIMDNCMADNSDWHVSDGRFPLPELYEFRDLKRTRGGHPLS